MIFAVLYTKFGWFILVDILVEVNFLDSCKLFHHCPFLLPHGEDVQKVLEQWKEYKMGVPTYGAIILDESLENVSWCCMLIYSSSF